MENPTVVVSLQRTDPVTVMVTDGERVVGNPTAVVGLGQTSPVMVMGPDREEISSWVIKMGGVKMWRRDRIEWSRECGHFRGN